MTTRPAPWIWPRIRPRTALGLLALATALGLWQGATVWLSARAQGGTPSWKPFLFELSAAWCVWVWTAVIHVAVANAPRPGGRWLRFLTIHGGAAVLFAWFTPAWYLGARRVFFHLLGWGEYRPGDLVFQLPMEWMKLLLVYVMIAAGFMISAARREAQIRELRAARLETELREAQLQALAAQLDPHFLFNALNTVSSVMYEDLARTDHLLASLGQMLRDGLESGGAAWPLSRELAHVEAYLDFAQARFGDRLQVRREIAAGAGTDPVPRFCLQRLVENALKHNGDLAGRTLGVVLIARREGDRLLLEVRDDGTGFREPRPGDGNGTGLRNLRATLALQYGTRATLEVAEAPEGGGRVALSLPAGDRHG